MHNVVYSISWLSGAVPDEKKGDTMKHLLKTMLLLLVAAGMLFAFTACDSSGGDDDEEDDFDRDFWAQTYSGRWYTVRSDLLATGTYCKVYAQQTAYITTAQAERVAAEFDDKIFNQITTNFGEHGDVDEDGKVTLLLLDIEDGYDPDVGGGYVAGYFDSTHMIDKDYNLKSNECDMIFVDVDPVPVESDLFYTTIAHEFQHLINYSQTVMVDAREQDLWINEGLSSGAEYVYSGEVSQDRVTWFNNDSLGTIAQGNNFFVWYGYWEGTNPNTVLDNYATVSLFFQWLRIHASNGTEIYKEILASEDRDVDAVTAAAENQIDSAFSDWGDLLETWYLANFRCRPDGFYGYKGEIDTDPVGLTKQGGDLYEFEAGEGIISALGNTPGDHGSFTPNTADSGTHIQYTGFNYADDAVATGTTLNKEFVLVLNTNTDNTPFAYEKGFIANVVTAPGSNPVALNMQARIVANKKPLPKKFAVGFHPGYAGSGETPEQRLLKNRTGLKPVTNIQGKKGY